MYMQTSTYQQEPHYYPYGGLMGESTGGDVQRYKYNGKAARTLLSNSYDEAGRLTGTTQGGAVSTTRGYNLHGWLTSIESTPFREYLYYEQPHNGSTAQYGGNISSMDWKTGDNILRGYTFQYDGMSRLTGAAYSENGSASTHYGTSYQYDLMGNITGLTRNGLQDDNSYGLIDNLSFDYNGNQLLKVTDAVTSGPNYSGAFHFNDHSDVSQEYEYDLNGNMTKDLNKKITSVEYNVLNLPEIITFASDSILYEYAADGRKVKVKYPYTLHPFPPVIHIELGMEEITGGVIHDPRLGIIELARPSHDYSHCGNLVYYDLNISDILIEGGFITYGYNSNEPIYHYFLTDHLGNTRVVVNEDGTIEQEDHYYPYGTIFGESEDYGGCKYMYNGKEIDRMHGLYWYDYGARHYDAAIASWPTMDPLCEKYYDVSPYVYCGNNPMNAIDFDGEDNYTINNAGRIILSTRTDDDFDVLMLSNDPNTRITLQDRNILKQLSIRRSDYNGGQYGTMNNFTESAKLFKFVADNTDVEWGFDAFRVSKGKTIFQIRTLNSSEGVSTHFTDANYCNLEYILHSHPRKNGNDYASGDFGSGRTFSNYSTPDSDYDTFIRINGSIQTECKESHRLPHFFLYNARTKNFFEYDFNRNSIGKRRINTYSNLINEIKRRLR